MPRGGIEPPTPGFSGLRNAVQYRPLESVSISIRASTSVPLTGSVRLRSSRLLSRLLSVFLHLSRAGHGHRLGGHTGPEPDSLPSAILISISPLSVLATACPSSGSVPVMMAPARSRIPGLGPKVGRLGFGLGPISQTNQLRRSP